MTSHSVNPVENSLINYLKKEGLYELIPEDRRPAALDFSEKRRELIKSDLAFISYYLVAYWALDTLVIWTQGGSDVWMFALFGPSVPLLIVTLLGIVGAIIVPHAIRKSPPPGQRQSPPLPPPTPPSARPSKSGALFKEPILLSFPILLTILNGFWTSWSVAATYAAFFTPLYLMYPLFYDDDSRSDFLYLLSTPKAYLRLGWITFKPMLRLFIRLAPVLLVVVIFSVFSQEFWQALGSLQTNYLVYGVVIMVLPALVFVCFFPFKTEVKSITHDFPMDSQILDEVWKMMPAEGRGAAFTQLEKDLEWREKDRLKNDILLIIRKKLKVQLMLLLTLTFIFSVVAFFVYFFSLLYVLLSHIDFREWKVDMNSMPSFITQAVTQLGLDVRAGPIAKVSLLLSVFVASLAGVYSLNESDVKKDIASSLKEQVFPWIAVGYVYLNIVSPNYQVWGCAVKDKRRRIASISILVNTAAQEEVVKEACQHVRERFRRYKTLRIVTAFEKAATPPADEWNNTSKVYTYGMPGKYWQSLPITGTGEARIIPYPEDAEAHDHTRDTGDIAAIPEGWFGNDKIGRDLSRSILTDNKETVLHPYTFDAHSVLSLIVWLKARLDRPEQYCEFVNNALVKLDTHALVSKDAITVHFYTNEDGSELFNFFYSKHLRDVAFKMGVDGKIRYQSKRRFSSALA